ncbi:Lantibiotic dehydratase domain protein [Catenulispora acidiphila DSM 44928]|uniref:Lantibiotic dehydratase domain protein n=1 Tax=Catenulispora acidiphila (strain DSM 44928 / JCM 14897 / NBRC 102108 / NRRL B-24433 / ID139908) TaxID=479433 RepID=C7QBX5_CATAD|nr:lantibiotic dehydratase [Catenulispora acidiphila]ACU72594.1 Lantibiotic dehydratase domain protein [Catenulispora acidiphila DSM 44928]
MTYLESAFMLRVAALPFAMLDVLRSPDSVRWARETLVLERELGRAGRALSDPIGARVPAVEAEQDRRRLLALRRQAFNNQLPGDLPGARRLAATLGGPTGEALSAWLEDRERLEAVRRAGSSRFSEELEAGRAGLRALCGEDRLQLGLLLASPTLDRQIGSWMRGGKQDKRSRKMERSLLSYLYRTAAKTSPFSTFTGVALGRFELEAGPDTSISGVWSSHPRLNVVALARLAEAVTGNDRLRGDLPVSAASGWDADADRVRFVRRSRDAGGDDAAVSFDAARDRLFFLRRSGALEELLGHLRGRGSVRYGELVDLLAARQDASRSEADHYLGALVQLGILQLSVLDIDVHSPDPLRAFQNALRGIERPWAEHAADLLEHPVARIEAYAAAGVDKRRALIAGVRDDLTEVLAALGAPEGSLPLTLFYEDVRAQDASVFCETGLWDRVAAEPLSRMARILPAFDIALPQQLTLKGFFLARHGVAGHCDDMLRLVHDFHEDIFDQYLRLTADRPALGPDGDPTPEENWLRLPEIDALDKARKAFVTGMRARWAALPPGAPELDLGEELLDEVAACLTPLGRSYAPQSHFVQLAANRPEPLAVLNDSFGGLCFPFTRFTHCYDGDEQARLSDQLRADLRRRQPDGAVFAEITAGAATTNLNLHGRLTDYEIVCPGESSSAEGDARIELDDLCLEHDPDDDRLILRSRRLGREVIPLYLGYLLPMVLPEVPRTLLLLSPTSRALPDVWRGVPEGPQDDGVIVRPRVRYRSLVVSRRRWAVPADRLPARGAASPDADWFLSWQRWRTAHGLPDRVFARVRHPDPGAGGAWFGGDKPHYVDFDSALSLIGFEGLLQTGDHVTFAEMLPAPEDLHVVSDRGRHVAELAVEIIPDRVPARPGAARHPGGVHV